MAEKILDETLADNKTDEALSLHPDIDSYISAVFHDRDNLRDEILRVKVDVQGIDPNSVDAGELRRRKKYYYVLQRRLEKANAYIAGLCQCKNFMARRDREKRENMIAAFDRKAQAQLSKATDRSNRLSLHLAAKDAEYRAAKNYIKNHAPELMQGLYEATNAAHGECLAQHGEGSEDGA
ncbi:hypothetical protein A3734_16725 [Sulfitobacter sp. HI0054]|uniref:hypothetical protein n=1 Tax=Sulfitobacter sp. HI0054 TaxID=1822238 RepID=UPI0007C39AB5|nr:hypothetical protein [Sulfitobacter sp. HI0054]KZY53120.1 hypothetical protein A3734_16725 [Sulfitobacter sp. HI0054]